MIKRPCVYLSSEVVLTCVPILLSIILISCSGSSSSNTSLNQGGGSTTPGNPVGPNLTLISSDPYTVGPGQHATEVEPHMLAYGSTLVAAFQTGRIIPGGATNIGWATSTDAGKTWNHGFLPGLTTGDGSGPYDAASDPVVAYDAKHGVWMIASLPLSATLHPPAVVVSRSTDGGLTWQTPISVNPNAASSDKNWIVCDDWANSPHYGNCYMEWDDPSNSDEIFMSTSADGGITWSSATPTASGATGIGGQPLVQPNGNVVVPIETFISQTAANMSAFSSTDGGVTWSTPAAISGIQFHADAGDIRSGPLPSAAADGAGTIWAVWEDCRFRPGCSTNDLVYSTSSDRVNWSAVTRIPIDDVSSNVDHFIPGIGIDPATSGANSHVALHYYYYSQSNCGAATCQLFVGYIASSNGGNTWSNPAPMTGAMLLSWLPQSQNGLMVGDYIATAFANGIPHGIFAVAQANSGATFQEAMYTAQGSTVSSAGYQLSSKGDKVLHNLSDRIAKETPEKGLPPQRRARRSFK
jgi:hypothetical protein